MLDSGELWHPLIEADYRNLLLLTLDENEWELSGGEDWRPEHYED